MKQQALEKLQSQLPEATKVSGLAEGVEKLIREFLDNDETFANMILKDEKSLSECCAYIIETMRQRYIKAHGQKNGGMYAAPDDIKLVMQEYYEASKEDVDKLLHSKPATVSAPPKSEANQPAKQAAPAPVKPAPKKAKKNKGEDPAQVSFFDMEALG